MSLYMAITSTCLMEGPFVAETQNFSWLLHQSSRTSIKLVAWPKSIDSTCNPKADHAYTRFSILKREN